MTDVTLPPGQRRIDRFPRFGAHLGKPAPAVPADPVIEICGAVADDVDVPLTTLASLPRQVLDADFHCVAGWSATGLQWEGVTFEDFYRRLVVPALAPHTVVTHLEFRGLDGYESVVAIEDALADDVLIAEHLDGEPLDNDHGAPVRLVSPSQYGYVSTKHLCRVKVLTSEPMVGRVSRIVSVLLRDHPRARVWKEERNGSLPPWFVRPVYRAIKTPLLYLCARGEGRSDTSPSHRTGRGS
ncbi:MAG: molybdopterin-dependent oxidoreductase [Actinomycetota bacterium]|nr:molybdopterin-dependent oxidoreductase [Actinomycetota bacterium]